MWYIHSEDMATVYIGPFPTKEAAEQHMDDHRPIYRRSGYNDYVIKDSDRQTGILNITPSDDAAMWRNA